MAPILTKERASEIIDAAKPTQPARRLTRAERDLYGRQVREQKKAASARYTKFTLALETPVTGFITMPSFKPIESYTEPGKSTLTYIHAANLIQALLVEVRRDFDFREAILEVMWNWDDPGDDVEQFVSDVEEFLKDCTTVDKEESESDTATIDTEGKTTESGGETVASGTETTRSRQETTESVNKTAEHGKCNGKGGGGGEVVASESENMMPGAEITDTTTTTMMSTTRARVTATTKTAKKRLITVIEETIEEDGEAEAVWKSKRVRPSSWLTALKTTYTENNDEWEGWSD